MSTIASMAVLNNSPDNTKENKIIHIFHLELFNFKIIPAIITKSITVTCIFIFICDLKVVFIPSIAYLKLLIRFIIFLFTHIPPIYKILLVNDLKINIL